MELTGKYRHELKYSISLADRMALVQRLRPLMQRDLHTDETGRYTIRSVYFDNYKDKALRESGTACRRGKNFASATITTIFPSSPWKRRSSTTTCAKSSMRP